MSPRELAIRHSARAFLNSLLREWPSEYRNGNFLVEGFEIPVEDYSPTGNHHFAPDFDFLGFLDRFVSAGNSLFRNRVLSSIAMMEISLKKRIRTSGNDFLSSEQGLFLGHPFHPHPKSRDEFSGEDFNRYSPEMAGSFPVEWLLVKNDRVELTSGYEEELRSLVLRDYDVPRDPDWIPYPAHPWQLRRLREKGTLAAFEADGSVHYLGPSTTDWHPTSSLRTLWQKDSPYMLKFSLSLRITNSIRHLLPREVVRGIEVKEVLATEKGKEWVRTFPGFQVMLEPAFIGLKSEAGELLPETLVVLRENPFRNESDRTVVAATLFQEDPEGKETLLSEIFRKNPSHSGREWFKAFLTVAVRPLLRAQSDYGILFGAHQQNLVLRLGDFLPEKAWFRDCQGTGYTPLGLANFGGLVPRLSKDSGNVLSFEYGNHLFAYYLIVNTTFGAVHAVSRASGVPETELLRDLRSFLEEELARDPADPSLLRKLLKDPTIRQKGNFRCSLSNMNENTTNDPLAIYNEIPNPLVNL